jgi:hypothetical protein
MWSILKGRILEIYCPLVIGGALRNPFTAHALSISDDTPSKRPVFPDSVAHLQNFQPDSAHLIGLQITNPGRNWTLTPDLRLNCTHPRRP